MDANGRETVDAAARRRVKRAARSQFEKWSHTYDRSLLTEMVFAPAVRACLEEIVRWGRARGERPFRALDVGCGTGTLLTQIGRDLRADALVGLDYAPQMVARAAEKAARAGLAARVHVVCGDAEHLPFRDGAFDVLTCCHSFHHYPHQAEAVREFARVLRPGGLMVLIDGFRDNVIGWLIFDVFVQRIERHVHHAPWSALRAMIAEAGFAAVHQRKLNVLAPLLVNVATR